MTDERLIEQGELTVALERDGRIARIRGVLAGDGEDECIDCGAAIDARRKAVLPSAERCVGCQSAHERCRR